MPLQHQEHETGHDQRLQLRVTHIITRTCEALKRQVMSRCESLERNDAVRDDSLPGGSRGLPVEAAIWVPAFAGTAAHGFMPCGSAPPVGD
jgi:hypothetical protein